MMLSWSVTACSNGNAMQPKQETNVREHIQFADPTVFVHDGKYYLTGTSGSSDNGFTIYESDDLKEWHRPGNGDYRILLKGDGTYGTKGFWAPQILEMPGGEFLLAYTANEQVAVARSEGDKLVSRYRQTVQEPVDGTAKNIDPFIFRDDDGRYYMYHVRFNNGNYIWVAGFDPESGRLDPATLRQCLQCDQAWENTGDYPSAPIMEGPTVIKLDGTYYLFYSANHFMSRDYAVGYATSSSPTGPWFKNPGNPIISRANLGENGSGHGDLFIDLEGKMRYVYHVHRNDSVVSPRTTRIVELKASPTENSVVPYEVKAEPSTVITPRFVE